MTERILLQYAWTEEDFQKFIDFLKEHFESAVCMGTSRNTRDPFNGGVRGYITITGDPKEVTTDE